MPRYAIVNPTHDDGIRYVTIDRGALPAWVFTIWARPGVEYIRPVEMFFAQLLPGYRAIPNDAGDHRFAHYSQPPEFGPGQDYLSHIHIQSDRLSTSPDLVRLIYVLVGLGYLPSAEAQAIENFVINAVYDYDNLSDTD